MKRLFIKYIYLWVAVVMTACSDEKVEVKEEIQTFKVIQPLVSDTTTVTDYVCDVHSINNVEIRSRVKGFIETIFIDEGKYVKKGQLLFRISSQEYKEELLKAKAVLKSAIAESKSAEIDLKNAELLAEKEIVSKTEVEMAKAKLEAAKAKVEEAQSAELSAQLKLSYCDITAPFDGVIDRIPNKTGSLLDEGDLVTTLSDNNEIFAYFNVSEKVYLDYMSAVKTTSENELVELVLANNEIYEHIGQIETIDGQFDVATGTIAFRARFSNPDKLLKHGASGKVRLTNKVKGALIIPQKTTFEVQDKVYVYVVNEKDEITLRNIQIQHRLPHIYIIEKGLKPSDKILFEGIQLVKPGNIITPELMTMADFFEQILSQE
jgi:RND family efflux transporter MFP subunit